MSPHCVPKYYRHKLTGQAFSMAYTRAGRRKAVDFGPFESVAARVKY